MALRYDLINDEDIFSRSARAAPSDFGADPSDDFNSAQSWPGLNCSQ